MNNFVNVFLERKDELATLLIQHIELTLLAVIFSVLIGVPLGIVITKNKKVAKITIGMANLVQAIPSLAILGFLIPFVGIGSTPAILMVVLYSILPILKNTYTALININPDTIEAAKGIGMTQGQILLKVKIPLAIPVIMAGVRISAVTAVGLMTIAAFIGAGGLGYLVFTGIQTADNNLILLGAIPAALLALIIDYIVGKVESIVTPNGIKSVDGKLVKKNKSLNKALVIVSSILVVILIVNYGVKTLSKEKTVVFASKNFTESIILINILEQLVEGNSDINVETKLNLGGSSVVLEALKSGAVDLSVDYTGTMLLSVLGEENTYNTPEDVYNRVRDMYDEKFGFKVLEPLGFNNTYALGVTQETKEKYNLVTISDLAKVSTDLIAGTTIEFSNRTDGLPGIIKEYNLNFKDSKAVDGALRYTALVNGSTDVVDAFTTDGLIKEFDLAILEDDKNFFPPYYACTVVREDALKEYPELEDALNILAGKITEEVMIDLNYKVDVDKIDPSQVAREFLIQNGYIE